MIAAAAVLAAMAMLAFMGRAVVTGEIPLTGDLLHFHYPLRQFYAGAVAAGDSVAWMPALYNGFYVAGEGQLGPYHPFHWLLYRWLPLDTAFGLELVAAYPFAFAGTWLFLRRWCANGPAAFGAMAFAFCGFMLEHGVHPNMVLVAAHVPWLLWAADATFRAAAWPARGAAMGTVALLVGSQLLFGHPQAVWLSMLIGAAYVAFLLARRTGPAPRTNTAAVAGGVILGAAVGSIQLLATTSATLASARAADPAFASTFALEPRYLLQLLEPYLFWGRVVRWTEAAPAGDEFGAYGGAVTLVLTAWWLGARWSADRLRGGLDRLGVAALVLGGLGLWLATGARGGLYLLQTWLPIVGGFRVPARFILFTDLALAVTAAIALHHLLRQPREGARGGLGAAWGIALASAVTALLLATGGTGAGPWPMVIGPLLFTIAAALVTLARYHAPAAAVALVLLAGADEALYGLAGVTAWHDFVTREEALRLAATPGPMQPGDGRLAHGGFPNLYTLAGYRVLDGYTALPPRRLLDYARPEALRVAQVSYVNRRFREATKVPTGETLGDGWWIATPAPLPRARLVTAARVSRSPAADLAAIDVATTALTDRPVALGGGPPGQVRIVEDSAGEIRLRLAAAGTELLVLSESFHEGWRATVDGREVEVERVNGDFLGCVVRQGDREVIFTFRPRHLVAGGYASAAAGAAALLLLLPARLRGRRQP